MPQLIKFLKDRRELLFLGLIVLFGLVVRLYRIGDNPPSLNWDEISHGYNAWSVLKTGRDEWGARLPLIFRAYGDYKLPLYIYLTTIPLSLFGLNPFSVRLVSVLSGAGLIVVAYCLAKKITKNNLSAGIAAFLTAIFPWSLFLSRVAVEANLALFLFSLGVVFLLGERYWLTSLFWGLSLHAYNSARVLGPILFLFLIFKTVKERRIKRRFFSFLIFLVFLIPVVLQFFDRSGGARFFWVSPVDQGAVNRIIEKRESSSLPEIVTRLVYNRPVYFLFYSASNYLKHFSPRFLFLRGGDHYQFSVPDQGPIYLVAAPFLIIGLIWLFKKKQWFLIGWFFSAFIPSAITRDSPHLLRSILVLPLPMVLSAIGLWQTAVFLKTRSRFGGRLVIVVFILALLIHFTAWWKIYWQIYRPAYSWAWQYGYQEAVEYVKDHYSHYDKIVFTKKYGEPHEFVLFYWPWEPSYYQQDPKKVWDYHANWYWVDGFDKFQFWNDWQVKEKLKGEDSRLLLITSPANWIEGGRLIKRVKFLDGEEAFDLVAYP